MQQMEQSQQSQQTPGENATPARRSIRPWIFAALVVVVVLAGVTATVVRSRQQADNTLIGTDLGAVPAPTFTLKDQNGATISLQQQLGRPVVVTFLYTHCPDVCPLTADKISKAVTALGSDANQASFIAVSVDPLGDTPDTATTFVATHHLTGRLHYLLGTSQQLSPVWKGYSMLVENELNAQMGTNTVSHSIGTFIIDKQGRERIYMDDTFDPAVMAKDIHILLGE